mgnify:CR=1 FL=1
MKVLLSKRKAAQQSSLTGLQHLSQRAGLREEDPGKWIDWLSEDTSKFVPRQPRTNPSMPHSERCCEHSAAMFHTQGRDPTPKKGGSTDKQGSMEHVTVSTDAAAVTQVRRMTW